MAIRTVVTRGYGSGASIALVTTRGYGVVEAVVSEDFFGAGDDQRKEEDEIIMAVIKGFIKRVA